DHEPDDRRGIADVQRYASRDDFQQRVRWTKLRTTRARLMRGRVRIGRFHEMENPALARQVSYAAGSLKQNRGLIYNRDWHYRLTHLESGPCPGSPNRPRPFLAAAWSSSLSARSRKPGSGSVRRRSACCCCRRI